MQRDQNQWLELGDGIELLRYRPGWDWQKSPQENLLEIRPEDLLSLKITMPERFLVAVDTAAKTQSLATKGSGPVIMATRVDWIYQYPSIRVIQCTCFESKHMKWYGVELALGYIALFEPELRLKALLSPPMSFGVPAKDMGQALQKCFSGLNSRQPT